MKDNSMDVFARAFLYIYQARLENMGLKADLKVVRREKLDEPELEEAG